MERNECCSEMRSVFTEYSEIHLIRKHEEEEGGKGTRFVGTVSYAAEQTRCRSLHLEGRLSEVWVEFSLPALISQQQTNVIYWGNCIGHLFVNGFGFKQENNQTFLYDTTGERLELEDEFKPHPDRPDWLVGRAAREQELIQRSKHPNVYHVCCFSLDLHESHLLPHDTDVTCYLDVRPLIDCYYSYDGSVPYIFLPLEPPWRNCLRMTLVCRGICTDVIPIIQQYCETLRPILSADVQVRAYARIVYHFLNL